MIYTTSHGDVLEDAVLKIEGTSYSEGSGFLAGAVYPSQDDADNGTNPMENINIGFECEETDDLEAKGTAAFLALDNVTQ